MALIKCKNCGQEISSSAERCIGCGRKIKIKKRGGILINIIIALVVLAFDALVVMFFIDIFNDYQDNWVKVVNYYDKNTREFICSIKYTIDIDDEGKVEYTSDVIKGNCEYTEFDYKGDYEYDWFEDLINVDFYNSSDIDSMVINYYYDYICVDYECSNEDKFYREDEFRKSDSVNSYIEYYDASSDDTNDYQNHFGYDEFMDLYNTKKDNTIVIFGNDTCQNCFELKDEFNELKSYYNLSYYIFNVKDLTEEQRNNIDAIIDLDILPATMFIKNGEVYTLNGHYDADYLKNKLQEWGFIKSMTM